MKTERTRPKPTKQLIYDLCGGNRTLLGSVHHGLSDVPLDEVYPFLDLEEAVVFAAASRKLAVANIVDSSPDLFDIFNRIYSKPLRIDEFYIQKDYRDGFDWLRSKKRIQDNLREKYNRLNPYEGVDLRSRLEKVHPDVVKILRETLKEKPREYVFECEYERLKRERRDNYGIEPMRFQTVYPTRRKGVIADRFAGEIARIISTYPKDLGVAVKPRTKVREPLQLALF